MMFGFKTRQEWKIQSEVRQRKTCTKTASHHSSQDIQHKNNYEMIFFPNDFLTIQMILKEIKAIAKRFEKIAKTASQKNLKTNPETSSFE